MSHAALPRTHLASLLLPAVLLAGLVGYMGVETDLVHLPTPQPAIAGPETVTIAPRRYSYRASGEYVRGTTSIDGPLITEDHPTPLQIMTYQVSAADYADCVADGACEKADPKRRGTGNVPVTGVSFRDASDYAAWLSQRTGATWRLPTIAEWTFAAGSKAVDQAVGVEGSNPADRWLANYEKQAALGSNALSTPGLLGSFGVNEFGVADLSGPVWEWTSSCGGRTTLDAQGNVTSQLESCGVRYLEGQHRTAMSSFVRDAVGGGCSVGAPPDNLGFRLVRE